MTRPSLYEYAGGDSALRALAAAHHERCLADPWLNHPFSHPGQHPEHVERLAAYWAEVLGGPATFTSFSGHAQMLGIHSGNEAPAEMGDRFHQCFVLAMDDAQLPDDPEFRTAMAAYMRWAVDEVMGYMACEAKPPTAAPMPRWSWDGLQA
ncbi:MAG: oxidoreductase [Hamadaea sp.]|uniref:globin domain-containing protein n=1 Tax=Hamadaea sp. TaxID=2024425 RepID=UPI0017D92A21|nr:oxidoreductase [Hamadaea sp.]NUR69363.1 oxidoreductase [Hamadaea sp.]NUT23180.1 oxidoreductase [Hamadaea sp.]